MKKIEAVIGKHAARRVREALSAAGIEKLIMTEIRGFGGPAGPVEIYRGDKFKTDFLEEMKVEMIVSDDIAGAAVAALKRCVEGENDSILISSVEQLISPGRAETRLMKSA